MSSITKNEERDIEYPAFTVFEYDTLDRSVIDELMSRTLGINALPVVYPISATQKINSDIAIAFRSALQKKLFRFLCTDTDAENYLIRNNKEFLENKNEFSFRPWLLNSYVQQGLFVMECVNLERKPDSMGLIKLTEGNGKKDRYTSVSYMNYFVTTVLDRELLREEDTQDTWDILSSLTQIW